MRLLQPTGHGWDVGMPGPRSTCLKVQDISGCRWGEGRTARWDEVSCGGVKPILFQVELVQHPGSWSAEVWGGQEKR